MLPSVRGVSSVCLGLLLLALAFDVSSLFAQEPTGAKGRTITGTVQNQDLRRVPQASVEIKDQEGTVVGTAVANDAGEFSVDPMPGLLLKFDRSGLLMSAASSDERYRTQEGIGPGSDVDDLMRVLPSLQIEWTAPELKADNRAHRYANVRLKGLILLLEQSYDPAFPLPQSIIKQVEVYVKPP